MRLFLLCFFKEKTACNLISFVLILTVLTSLLSSCSGSYFKYQNTYIGAFDTVTVITGYSASKKEFDSFSEEIYDSLKDYSRLYDIYNEYDGLNNLKTVNDSAGVSPVIVDDKIIDLLEFSKTVYFLTDGSVNIAMGSVLRLWHAERELSENNPASAKLPEVNLLREASNHVSIDGIIIDRNNNSVFITDSDSSIDVGAVAKGYALERVSSEIDKKYDISAVINVGGNVTTVGSVSESKNFTVGIKNPDSPDNSVRTVSVSGGVSVVTSGDYERYYTVDGKEYNHIIDPATLFPSEKYRSVTVIYHGSGIADALSTAFFILDKDQCFKIAEKIGADAFWILQNGETFETPGFSKYSKK